MTWTCASQKNQKYFLLSLCMKKIKIAGTIKQVAATRNIGSEGHRTGGITLRGRSRWSSGARSQ
jgi:hypothetical protein